MQIRPARAPRSVVLITAAAFLASLSGCASIAGGSQSLGNAVGIHDRTTASTVGGCIVGGLTGALAGGLAKGWVGAGIGLAGGCAAGGFLAREASIQVQLEEAQKLAVQVNPLLAASHQQVVIKTSMIKSPDREDHQIKKLDEVDVPMPAGHGPDVQAVLAKVTAMTAASKKVPRIDVFVKRADEQAYATALNDGLQGSKVDFKIHLVTKNPHLVVTPIPDPVPAAAGTTGASTSAAPAAGGAIYQPSK
ncbi:hypothetical protein [Burkholderia anthina]|uniref:hypothetical protein n=1 Tax=Burkholderia anthina TaxID=179879 RepID=UPI0037C0233D